MSSVYVLEPPTKGKVVLNTTAGPLDIELWAKEAPKAVRNFVQLCVDGYYNGTVFHRLIKTFMVQGGDPTGTGTGGDTIYGGPFSDEIHSRLRFNHRGVVACANAGTPHTNNSQFFITFDRCDWLDKKNTIFGKITGDTVYNLMKIGDLETDKDDRPVDPPVINSVEVLWNPFDDVVPRNLKPKEEIPDDKPQQKTAKPKKKLNLLSFGEEAEAEEQAVETVKGKIKSSHDVLQDPRLLKNPVDSAEMDPVEARRLKGVQTAVRQALSKKDNVDDADRKPSDTVDGESSEDEDDFEASMRKKVLEKRARLSDSKGAGVSNKKKEKQGGSNVKKEAPIPRDTRRVVDDSDDEKEGRKEKLSLKKGLGSEARAALAANVDADVQLLTPLEQQRARFKQKKRLQGSREGATLAKLAQFKSKLGQSMMEAKETDADDENWFTHELKFERDLTKTDEMERNEDPNQYVVHDPLLEKGKEKFNKEQAKFKKRNREWAGKSLT